MEIEFCAENRQEQVTSGIFNVLFRKFHRYIWVDLRVLGQGADGNALTALLASFCVQGCEIEAYKYCNEDVFGLSLNFQQTWVKTHSVG